MATQSASYFQGFLVDVYIVRKQSGIGTEYHIDQFFNISIVFLKLVQFFPLEGEYQAGSIVLFIGIFQITGPVQDFQGTVHLYGEVFEVMAEFIDVEWVGASESVSHSHLVVELDVFVYFADVFLVGKSIRNAFVECGLVALGI